MTTELHAAWVYDCDGCGKENFQRAMSGNADEAAMMLNEAMEERQEVVGLLTAEEGDVARLPDGTQQVRCLYSDIVLAPKYVTCQHCGHKQAAGVAKVLEPDDGEEETQVPGDEG